MSIFGDIGVATRNGLKNLIESRERAARAQVHSYLHGLDDETLAKAGYKRSELMQHTSSSFLF